MLYNLTDVPPALYLCGVQLLNLLLTPFTNFTAVFKYLYTAITCLLLAGFYGGATRMFILLAQSTHIHHLFGVGGFAVGWGHNRLTANPQTCL